MHSTSIMHILQDYNITALERKNSLGFLKRKRSLLQTKLPKKKNWGKIGLKFLQYKTYLLEQICFYLQTWSMKVLLWIKNLFWTLSCMFMIFSWFHY